MIILFFLVANICIVSAAYENSEYAEIFRQETGVEPHIIEIQGNKTALTVDETRDFFAQTRHVTSKYMHPDNGSIVSYGYHFSSGYFTVKFLEGSEVNASIIDEIYKAQETEGQKIGIQDVGVVFQYSELPMTHEEQTDTEDGIDSENNNPIPAFSALTLLLVFSTLMWLRR